MRDDVTVLIPVQRHARKDWLNEAIASVGKQAKVLVLENDGELATALNNGLTAAGTEFVFRLDYDDLIADNTLELLREAAWDADVVYSKMILVSEDLKALGEHTADDFCPRRLEVHNYIQGCSLIRRETALKVGGYRHLDALEDWDLWVRMSRAGATFKPCPEALYFYRQVAESRNKMTPEKADELKQEIVGTEPEIKATWYAQEGVGTTYWRCQLPSAPSPDRRCGATRAGSKRLATASSSRCIVALRSGSSPAMSTSGTGWLRCKSRASVSWSKPTTTTP